ncbi:cation diffusion facilitator family transporter [Halorhodospira halophila]|uniref:Cation diffusion facilitator family transporter n=1 Tax=Halorhodospira halophila (strain DSM 244 / SL1) TaxID=349124 RepID=A1WUH7_HALHL|nr:cation diffusion facilitator family transporter [Halorhodospira halophila]ABM61339.1 cation diffusion facilitator family transporter [Halorhodospira halophila SL1]MBK1729078.1 cation transporter [Halorhodospira halophila]
MTDDAATPGAEHLPAKQRVTVIGAVVNLLLGIGKVGAGIVGQSQALIADGAHSLSDLISDGVVLGATTYGSRGADQEHPYGHARIETVATAFIGAALMVIAGGFIYDAVHRLFFAPETLLVPGWLALSAALASILAKEALYQYTRVVARRARSNIIHANAWHHRSDALSSVVVVVGILGVLAGVPWLDAVGAIVVASMLGYMGLRFVWQSLRELVDTGLTAEQVRELEAQIHALDGVRGVHGLRSRYMAESTLIDVHVVVDPRISVSEGHRVAEAVREHLVAANPEVAEVLVHVEHEDPAWHEQTRQLPRRREVERTLRRHWSDQPLADRIHRLDLHYLQGRLEVELHLAWQAEGDPARQHAEAAALAETAEAIDYVSDCRIFWIGHH